MYTLKDIKVWMPRKDNAPSTRRQRVVVLSADLSTVLEEFYIEMKFGSYTAASVKELDKRFGRNGFVNRMVHGRNITDVQFNHELYLAIEHAQKFDGEFEPQLMSKLKFELICECKTKNSKI